LGTGAFGKVMLCKKKDSGEFYAIKRLRKDEIVEKK
jgi:serum/glucocorticoid-regulated kinase 2